jgi:outer membrane protein OmpA-like peptidoglycan-associated protein
VRAAEAERERLRADARAREAQLAQQQSAQAQAQAASAADRARRLEAELRELQAKQTPRGMVVTLGDVLFDTGSATLRSGAMLSLQRVAEALRSNPERRVLIEGFTDSVGSESFNQELSQRRAEAVRAVLITNGIAPDRIEVRGHGEAYPVASNDTASGRQLNRRVEILFSDQSGRFAAR